MVLGRLQTSPDGAEGSNPLVFLSMAIYTPELKHPEYIELIVLWSMGKTDFSPMLIVKTSDLRLC